jgi:proton-dependent oligopeptide transporter, POT family
VFVAAYVGVSQAFGILGGILSDAYWGKSMVQHVSNVILLIGTVLMLVTAIPGVHTSTVSLSRQLLSISGVFVAAFAVGIQQPAQSAFVGDQIPYERRSAVAGYFAMYYLIANLSDLVGELLCPILRADVSYIVLFAFLTGIALIATVIFSTGHKFYTCVPPDKQKRIQCAKPSEPTLEVLKRIGYIFAPIPVYFALMSQQTNTWVWQAKHMNRNFGGYDIPADSMPTLDDILVCVFIPLLNQWIYPAVERCGVKLAPLVRMSIGIFSAALAFVCSGILQLAMDRKPDDYYSVAWQVPQYVFISLAEVMVSVTGLEFAYSQTPPSLRSVTLSMWYAAAALGQVVVIAIEKIDVGSQAGDFFFFCGLMLLFLALFVYLSKKYRYVKFETADESNSAAAASSA